MLVLLLLLGKVLRNLAIELSVLNFVKTSQEVLSSFGLNVKTGFDVNSCGLLIQTTEGSQCLTGNFVFVLIVRLPG